MIWGSTIAEQVGQLVLAQAMDRPEAPLYVALFWGFVAAFLGFLAAINTNGLVRTLRKIYLIPALFAFIGITWFISGKGHSDTSAVLTVYGGIGASVIVVILLLIRGPSTPRDPS